MSLHDHQRWLRTHGREGRRLTALAQPPFDADLRLAALPGVRWSTARLGRSDLRWATFQGGCLEAVQFHGDARGADLRQADLRDADLTGADLRGADLTGADLRGACLFGTRLDGAHLKDAQFDIESLNPACLDATMRDVQARAVASGGLEWIREAIATGELEIPHLSANGQGLAARFMTAMPAGSTPTTSLIAERLAAWLREASPWDWPTQLDQHAAWLASQGRAGERLAVLGADLRAVDLDGRTLRFAALPRADLSGTCIAGLDLRGADLTEARLTDARWSAVQLDGADLSEMDARRALIEGSLEHVTTTGALWDEAVVSGRPAAPARPTGPSYVGAILTGRDWGPADLRGADFRGAQLQGVRFEAADLRQACLDSALVGAARFGRIDGLSAQGAALSGSIFGPADDVDLRGADLRNITIDGTWRRCDLRGAVLGGADLRRAVFEGCDLRGVMFNGVQIAGARFDGCTLATHTLVTAGLAAIEAAFQAVPPEIGAQIRASMAAGRPAAWHAPDHPIVHGWLVTLGAGPSDLHHLTAGWLSTS